MEYSELKKLRFREMKQTQKWIKNEIPRIKTLLAPYRLYQGADLDHYVCWLLVEKLKKNPVRAYFLRKVYEYVVPYLSDHQRQQNSYSHNLEELFCVKLPFVFELIIVIQYLHNHILDGKYGVRKPHLVNQNLLAGNILREMLFQYIDKEVGALAIGPELPAMVRAKVADALLWVDIGQRLDKDFNHFGRYQKDNFGPFDEDGLAFRLTELQCVRSLIEEVKAEVAPEKGLFVELYFRRIYLTNVILFVLGAELVMDLLDYHNGERDRLRHYTTAYGLTLQVINDYSDFAVPRDSSDKIHLKVTNKDGHDTLCDLKNKTITLPLIYHLHEGYQRQIEDYLESGNKRIIQRYRPQIMNEIVDSGAILKSIIFTRKLAERSKDFLDKENEMTKFLENMSDIAKDNKFYTHFLGR